MNKTRFQKIEAENLIKINNNQKALSVGLHIIHEVTSAQAFTALEKMGLPVKHIQNTFAVTDHVVSTGGNSPPNDIMDELLIKTLEENCKKYKITHYGTHNHKQGICHVVAPEIGLTRPNLTIFCGDSHTSTHGAFGAIAAGIGTSNVRDILASGCLLNYHSPQQVKIQVDGKLPKHVSAKDLILFLLSKLGVCNMTIEMGGRFGYCDVDNTTINWFKQDRDFWKANNLDSDTINRWKSFNCDKKAIFDKEIYFDAQHVKQMISFGLTLNDIVDIDGKVGQVKNIHSSRVRYEPITGENIVGLKIEGAFIGSCTNGRYSDFKAAAEILQKHGGKIKVKKALAVPGSLQIKKECESKGLDQVFKNAGFEWRDPGCSACLAMNPDKFIGRVASSTNRNFHGRQGPQSRTFLMSPQSVALSALFGKITNLKKI
jgi:3-isopropylmalate/(R)-2-methylmalate dehydratase large subunit